MEHLQLNTLRWEHTHPAVATAKGSGHCLHLLNGLCHCPGPCNPDQPVSAPPYMSLPLSRARIQALPIAPISLQAHADHTPAHPLSRGEHLHTLRKETANIQIKSRLHAKRNSKPSKDTQGCSHINSNPRLLWIIVFSKLTE